jgi:type II secretory pathway component PulF
LSTDFFSVASGLLWLIVSAMLLFAVPAYERQFVDFGLVLPWYTQALIACSRWCIKYAYIWPLPWVTLVVGVAVSIWLIRWQRPALGALWFLAMAVLPGLVAFLIFVGCHLPWLDLLDGLAGQKR